MTGATCKRWFESSRVHHVGLAGAGKPAKQPDRPETGPPFAMGHGMSAGFRCTIERAVVTLGSCVGENPTFQENGLPRPFGPRNDNEETR